MFCLFVNTQNYFTCIILFSRIQYGRSIRQMKMLNINAYFIVNLIILASRTQCLEHILSSSKWTSELEIAFPQSLHLNYIKHLKTP